MTSEPVDRDYGTPLSEWIAVTPNELEIDAVGLWQIMPVLRLSFGLTGDTLDDAVRKTLRGLLDRGARPVKGSSTRQNTWGEISYNGRSDIVEAVIDDWKNMGRDPDVGDVWFMLPQLIDE